MSGNITSINAILTLTIPGLYSSPQQIQGFSATNIFDVGTQELTETQMGLDGDLAAGVVRASWDMTIQLLASSVSNAIFTNWALAIQQQQDPLRCSGGVTLKGTGLSYALLNGAFKSWQPIATAARTLDPKRYVITWQGVAVNPIVGV